MANNYAVTTYRDEVEVWTAAEWEEAADTFVNVHTDWCDTLEEAEELARNLREHHTPRDR